MTVFCLMAMPHPAHAQVKIENYKMAGPYEIVARDGVHRRTKAGSERDMQTAHECAKKGQHETALMIINAYAGTLQGFDGHDAHNVSILGRGIARPERGYEGAHVYRSGNVLIDGLTVNTCPIGESHDVTLRDVRSISHPQWGDGLNVFGGCENILFDRVFCRNSDDCTTVYATRKGFKGSVKNVRMTNSTLWADVAHPIMIGLHGAPCNSPTAKSDTIAHLIYENIDIICQAENQIDYQGCMAINCGDDNVVKDVVFDNIRIEQITHGSLMHIKVVHNDKYGFAPGKSIEDVRFHCIRYTGTEPKLSIITGYSTDRKVSGILFDDVRINGRHLYDKMRGKPSWYHTSDYIPAYVGPHVENLRFK